MGDNQKGDDEDRNEPNPRANRRFEGRYYHHRKVGQDRNEEQESCTVHIDVGRRSRKD